MWVFLLVSNMKKLFTWYNTLQSTGNLKLKESDEAADTTEKAAKIPAEKKAEVKKATQKDSVKVKTSTV